MYSKIPIQSRSEGIPNMPAELANAAAGVLRELSEGFAGRVSVVTAPSWRVEPSVPAGDLLFVSGGHPERLEFSAERQLEFFAWLSGAEALDIWKHPGWPESELHEALVRFGAVTL